MVWSDAYGFADITAQQPMTVDSTCRAESISKSVTAWGVMSLVEQDLIDLDAPIHNYLGDIALPESKFEMQDITVRSLLSQTSGISLGIIGEEYPPQSPMPSLKEYLANEFDVIREPGSTFMYSNTNYNLLELIIEEVTGQEFSEYMTGQVLNPLGMFNSSYFWQEEMEGKIPTGYDLSGNPIPPYVYPAKGSGGLFATVKDIARFVIAGMSASGSSNNPVLETENIQAMYSPQIAIPGLFSFVADSYGYGHFIENLPSGGQAVWHGGQGHGWMTHFHSIPETGDGIVILTNSQRSWPLIAHILISWARWVGIGSVKFGIISTGAIAIQVLIGIIVFASQWLMYRLLNRLRRGTHDWAPLANKRRLPRILQGIIGTSGIAALWWSAAQPYLFVSSLFPSTANLAGVSLLGLFLVLTASALFPQKEADYPNLELEPHAALKRENSPDAK
jgi:CubicO group peptidase (beta-lactamase class C family)